MGEGFGANFRPVPTAAVEAAGTPSSGQSAEVIWHQYYDTQTYVDNTTTVLEFFTAANNDRTITNLNPPGILPRFFTLRVHQVCADILSTIPVTTAASGTVTGVLTDLALLTISVVGRPIWVLNLSGKDYGPYSFSALHATGGPDGTAVDIVNIQYARNATWPGWNYCGRMIIRELVPFLVRVTWAAAVDLTADKRIRISLFGVLNRNIQ